MGPTSSPGAVYLGTVNPTGSLRCMVGGDLTSEFRIDEAGLRSELAGVLNRDAADVSLPNPIEVD